MFYNYFKSFEVVNDGYFSKENLGLKISDKKTLNSYVEIKVLYDGLIEFIDYNNLGKNVLIKTNPQFAGGINELFFTKYSQIKYLDLKEKKKEFCQKGTLLGRITKFGLNNYIILSNYQDNVQEKKNTKLLNHILEVLKIKLDDKVAIWKDNKLYYNPFVIMNYFKKIQDEF
jgi:hypothetical protein